MTSDERGTGADSSSYLITYVCEVCRTPNRVEGAKRIDFPDDAEEVLDFISIHRAKHPCVLCGNAAFLYLLVVVRNTVTGEIIAGATTADLRMDDAEVVDGKPVQIVSMEELWNRVRAWTNDLFLRAVGPVMNGAWTTEKMPDGSPLLALPVVLAATARLAAGELPLEVQTEPRGHEEAARSMLRAVLPHMVVAAADAAYTRAYHHEGLHNLVHVMQERLPRETLLDEVFQALSDRCVPVEQVFNDPSTMDKAFRFELINAAVHAAVERPNPRVESWIALMLWLFIGADRGHIQIEKRFLLGPPLLPATVPFPKLHNALVQLLDFKTPDVERMALATRAAAHFGYETRFAEELAGGVVFVDLPDSQDMTDEQIVEMFDGIAQSPELAGLMDETTRDMTIAWHARTLLRNGRTAAAEAFATMRLDQLLAMNAIQRLAAAVCRVAENFNEMREQTVGKRILDRYGEAIEASIDDLPLDTAVDFLNEWGNAYRYAFEPQAALKAYRRAEEMLDADDGDHVRQHRVLARNTAIVLRELDRPLVARRILEELIHDADPQEADDYVGLLTNLVATLSHVNLDQEALRYAMMAASVPLSGSHGTSRLLAIINLASIKAKLQVPLQGELEEARALVEHAPSLKSRVAGTALYVALSLPVAEETIRWAVGVIEKMPLRSYEDASALLMLANWQVSTDRGAAQATLNRYLVSFPPDQYSIPWQWSRVAYRLAEDPAERWVHLRDALGRLHEDSPVDSGGSVLASWMSDKDEFLREIIPAAKAAYRSGNAEKAELLAVLDFANGRDVVTPQTAGEVEEAAPDAHFVGFLEDSEDIWIMAGRLADPDTLEVSEERLSTADVVHAANRFSKAIARSVRGGSAKAEAIIAPLLDRVGRAVERLIPQARHICFVPSSSLLAVPLHAALVSGGAPLLERNTVSYSPNLRIAHELSGRASDDTGAMIAVVPKSGERADFVERGHAVADTIASILGADVLRLAGEEATRDKVLLAFASQSHVVLLCHGCDAGQDRGRALCVSDGETLPPPLLPFEEAPTLRRFALDALDLEQMEKTPGFVSTIACSAGRAIAGAAGARIGIERALFMNGTRTLLAPLWDVDQESALQFLLDFYRSRNGGATVAEAYRRAALQARERTPSLFEWAPMQLKGNWLQA